MGEGGRTEAELSNGVGSQFVETNEQEHRGLGGLGYEVRNH